MPIRKAVDGEIFLPRCIEKTAKSFSVALTPVSDMTYIEIVPNCGKNEKGNYLVRDETEFPSIIESPQKLSDGYTEGLTINFRGLHTGLRRGERINVHYNTHTGVHWGLDYEILGENNQTRFKFN